MPAVPPPVRFWLPAGWHEAPAEALRVPGMRVVALHEPADEGFTANITLSAQTVTEPDAVAAMADAAVERLRATERDVTVRRRGVVGHEQTPGLAQEVRLTTTVGGKAVELAQLQAFLPAADLADPGQQVVYTVTFTATVPQSVELGGDFQAFVRSVRPAPAPEAAPEPSDE